MIEGPDIEVLNVTLAAAQLSMLGMEFSDVSGDDEEPNMALHILQPTEDDVTGCRSSGVTEWEAVLSSNYGDDGEHQSHMSPQVTP